jgi:uncharacterized protein (DUF2267 family)
MTSAETFVAHVAAHGGIANERATGVTVSVLTGLGAYLTPEGRRFLADELPEPLGNALCEGGRASFPIDAVGGEPGAETGRTHELVASVCRVLAEELSDDALRRLRDAVPASVRELLATPAPELVTRAVETRGRDTLSTGKPGSRHPISEGRAPEHQGEAVAETNPHASSKLSSTRRER